MILQDLRESSALIDLFVQLCKIPSPPMKEKKLAEKILKIFNNHNVQAEYDMFNNIIAKIPPSQNCKNILPILLSAHMDVVGGSEEVNIRLSEDGKFIETDKKRTLGADNKAGIAIIMDLAINLVNPSMNIDHGPVEITFTRDEEKGMEGIHNLDTAQLKSKYAIIADGGKLGELDCEGASFTNVYIKITGGKGGHSGINIHEKDRVNAVKVLTEIDSRIPQGVYKFDDKKGVITSINVGVITGGTINTFISEVIKEAHSFGSHQILVPEMYNSENILDTINEMSALNLINTDARAAYSIRSSEPYSEAELIELIKNLVNETSEKYKNTIKIEMDIKQHLMPFVSNEDDFLVKTIIEAANICNINCTPGSFHAGAETHVFANEKKNFYGESFNPVIIGVANLFDIHSSNEKIDWQSFITGRKWLEQIIVKFAKNKGFG